MLEPTNTLASANFDILKFDSVEDPLIGLNKLATMDLEESYTAMAINFINESREELTNNKIKFYHSLNEATTDGMVLESFSEFYASVKEIIKKFIKFLRKLVDKFVASFMSIIKSDKYIKKHQDLLKNLESDIEFEFDGYNYTFSLLVPSHNAIITSSDIVNDFKNNSNKVDIEAIKNAISNVKDEKNYDEFRAKILGKGDGEYIYLTNFSDEVFKVFRDGDMATSKITADEYYIRNCLYKYNNYDKVKKEVETQRNNTEKAYNSLEKELESALKSNTLDLEAFKTHFSKFNLSLDFKDGVISSEYMASMDLYVKAKIDQIQECSNIHLIAFGAKLDALKEELIQNRNVLYTALRKTNTVFYKDSKGGKR